MSATDPSTDVTAARAEMLGLMGGFMRTQALAVVARLGVPDLVGETPVTVDELAVATRTHPPSLYRLLRFLASLGVFTEGPPRSFAATPLSDALHSHATQSLRHLAIAFGTEQYRAWAEAGHAIRTGLPAFEQVFGTGYFEYLAEHPEESDNFDRAMAGNTRARVTAMRDHDWAGVEVVADIGGGNGALLTAVLGWEPGLRGIVFDLPHVASSAREAIAAAGLADRCTTVAGDFFADALPAADAYVLAYILHDRDDARATQILRNCRRAIPELGRLLLLENVVPPGNEPSYSKQLDLHMLVLLGGKERTEEEWRGLLTAGGFRLERITPGVASHLLEAAPAA